jgi:hypothetical protein
LTPEERGHVRELVVHGVAFCVAAGIGAIILHRYYWAFERDTNSASEARGGFLTAVVIAGGIGPALTVLFFWLRNMIHRPRG